jgi:hypothetical protein
MAAMPGPRGGSDRTAAYKDLEVKITEGARTPIVRDLLAEHVRCRLWPSRGTPTVMFGLGTRSFSVGPIDTE